MSEKQRYPQFKQRWFVVTKPGYYMYGLSCYRLTSIRETESFLQEPWEHLYKDGWRCIPVTVTHAKPKKKTKPKAKERR